MNVLEVLIVDGYNIINNWPEFESTKEGDLAHVREMLLEILADYRGYSGEEIILVFDAHQVKGEESFSLEKGVKIIYSRQGETADSVIEKLIYNLPKGVGVAVATSDRLEQQIVLGKGGIRISARELREKVLVTREKGKRFYNNGAKSMPLAERLEKDLQQILEDWRRR